MREGLKIFIQIAIHKIFCYDATISKVPERHTTGKKGLFYKEKSKRNIRVQVREIKIGDEGLHP